MHERKADRQPSTDLGRRLAAGDATAVAQLALVHGGEMDGYLRRFHQLSAHDREDVVQTVLANLCKNAAQYDPTRMPFERYYRMLLRHEAFDVIRRRKSEVRTTPIEPEIAAGIIGTEYLGALHSLEKADLISRLAMAVLDLPPHYRQAIECKYLRRHCYPGILAAELGKRPATVVQWAHRGELRLRELLGLDEKGRK